MRAFLNPRTPNKSLDASGGSASRNLPGAAKGALIRAAASTQPFDGTPKTMKLFLKYTAIVIGIQILFCIVAIAIVNLSPGHDSPVGCYPFVSLYAHNCIGECGWKFPRRVRHDRPNYLWRAFGYSDLWNNRWESLGLYQKSPGPTQQIVFPIAEAVEQIVAPERGSRVSQLA
jgi:hypothetical protein